MNDCNSFTFFGTSAALMSYGFHLCLTKTLNTQERIPGKDTYPSFHSPWLGLVLLLTCLDALSHFNWLPRYHLQNKIHWVVH